MAEEKESGYCAKCNKRVMVARPGTNHILHLLLTILTVGLWLIVWIGCAIKVGGWRCSVCGKPASRFGSPSRGEESPMRKCPHCAEMILGEASRCRYCQSQVTPTMTGHTLARMKSEAAKDSLVGWSVIAGGIVIAIIIWKVVTG